METNRIQVALYSLIERFIQRQRLVKKAIQELRPNWPQRPASWSGHWGESKEWEYYLHGIGCRLIHTVTQERLEWDLGPLRRFDRYWFVDHLKWLLDQNINDEAVAVIREWRTDMPTIPNSRSIDGAFSDAVFTQLEQLHKLGMLSRFSQGHYYKAIPPKKRLELSDF
jgi:hypothetical protein